MLKRLPPAFRNFYVVTGISFLRTLENEREYYQEKIKEVEKDREELMGTSALLEKFAREKYLMKKPSEDIFIIEKKD
jgi:cell division protein FtsB